MPKISTFPTLLDEARSFTISDLRKWQYLKPDQWKSGVITWSRNGNRTASISIEIDMSEQPFLKLSYRWNDEPVDYKVPLVSVPSNLGRGKVWYFLCPATGKRCRKLYGVGKYFLHRKAYPDAMYEKQTYSKYGRSLDKMFRVLHGSGKLYEELYSKHFKTHYAGKPTKRYQKILSKLKEVREKEDYYLKMYQQVLVK